MQKKWKFDSEHERWRLKMADLWAATQCERLIGLSVTCDYIGPQSLAEHMFSSSPTMIDGILNLESV